MLIHIQNKYNSIIEKYLILLFIVFTCINFDKPSVNLINGYAAKMNVKNTNTNVTGINELKWYEQNNISNPNSALNCYVSSNMQIQEVLNPTNGSFAKLTTPINNTIKQLQFSFWQGGSYIPNLTCKYIVMAKHIFDIPKNLFCWSDPYIVITEGSSGTGPLRKEVIDDINNETAIVLDAEVFPNPTEGKITIKIPVSEGSLLVIDAQGKQVGALTEKILPIIKSNKS